MKLFSNFPLFISLLLQFLQLPSIVSQDSGTAAEVSEISPSSSTAQTLDENNVSWWYQYCSGNGSKLALQTIGKLQRMKYFDISVLLDPALIPIVLNSCVRRLKLHQNFQVAFNPQSNSRLNSSAFFSKFRKSTLLLHFLDHLGPQELILAKLQELRKTWRPQGYPSYFILTSPNVFASEAQLQSELQTWAPLVAVDLNVYIWTHFSNWTVESLYEIYVVKNVTFVRDLFVVSSFARKGGKEPTVNETAELISRKLLRRSNFGQAPIIGSNVPHPDYEAATKFKHFPNSTHVEFESGFEVFIFWYLRDGLNFTDAAIAWDRYIKQGPNGTLVGMAIPINNGTIDVAITMGEFLFWRVADPDGLTYLQPMFYNLLIACFRQPPASSIRNIFLETFSNTLWLSLLALWVLLCLALTATVRIGRMLNPLLRFSPDDDLPRDSWLWAISTTCQKGWYITPHCSAPRTVFLVGFFSSLITFTAYSAALVATLSIQVIPVKSFADLLQYDFNVLSDNHCATAKFIVESLENNQVISKIPDSGRNVEIADEIDDLSKRRTAIVSQTDSLYPVLARRGVTEFDACSQLSLVPYDSKPVLSGFIVKRGSPFRTYFNSKMVQMRERGVMLLLRKRYLEATTFQCSNEGSDRRDAITMKDVLTAYAALFIGVVVSGTSFLIERFQFKRKEKRRDSMELINRYL